MTENNNDFIETPAVENTVEDVVEDVTEAAVEEITETPVVVKAKKEPKVVTPKPASGDKVALFSERNVSWGPAGTLKAGYNIVTKEIADVWLGGGSPRIRLATPEEIATKGLA